MYNTQAARAYYASEQLRKDDAPNKKIPLTMRALLYMVKHGELQWEQGIGGQWIAHSKRVDP